jgi:hypothetical protein
MARSLKRRAAARKGWRTRRAKYGEDGLTPKGERKIVAVNRRRAHHRRRHA